MTGSEYQAAVGDTGDGEADRIIAQLSATDVPLEAGVHAIAFIRRLVADNSGPAGFAKWKDAAVDERVRRVELEQFLEMHNLVESFRAWSEAKRSR